MHTVNGSGNMAALTWEAAALRHLLISSVRRCYGWQALTDTRHPRATPQTSRGMGLTWELLATQAPPARVHVTLLTNGCIAESPVGIDCCGRGGAADMRVT